MAGPYDYTVNIPQPPAQNFLQSLTGIMQLRQMQDQAEIAAQQAKFQKEMQPLEMQKAQAAIAAARAGTSATQTSQQAAAYQLQQRKDLDAELLGLSSDPSKFTAENLQRLAVRFHSVDPTLLTRAGEMRKNLPDQAKIFGDNIAKNLVLTSVTGDPEEAIKQLDKQLEAAKNTPGLQDFVPRIEQLKDNFIKYPDQTVALAAVGQTLFAPDQGKAITDVLSEQAKIGKTKAETKKELALAAETKQQKQVDEEKRALDLQKEKLQIQELQQKLDQVKPEKPLPSSLLRANAEINKSVDSANEMADKLEQASEAIRGLPSRGFLSEKYLQLKQIFRGRENPEITIRNNAAQLAGLGMLGAEKTAMGGAIRSNVQFQYATSKLPDAYQSPQALADKLAAQAQVQRKISKLMAIDAEWNSAFRGSQKAKTDEEILGYNVPAGTSRTQFKEMVAKELFPSQTTKPGPTAPTSNLGRPVSTETSPVAPVGGTPSDVDAILKQFGVR